MSTAFEQVDACLPVAAIRDLIKAGIGFPWILCDAKEEYRGLLTQDDALQYLASC